MLSTCLKIKCNALGRVIVVMKLHGGEVLAFEEDPTKFQNIDNHMDVRVRDVDLLVKLLSPSPV